MTLPVYLSGERIQGKTTDSLGTAEVVYTTDCFDNNDDDRNSDEIATRSGNNRHWGGVKVVSGGALNGKYAKKIRVKLAVNGATTGNLVGQIRSGCTSGSPGSQGTLRKTSTNTIDLSTIQDSTTFIEFTFDGLYAFGTNSDEFIGIYWAANQSNGSNTIWIAMRWNDVTENTADVISATNDGAPNQVDFEFWNTRNTNMSITYDDGSTPKDKSSITNVPAGTRYEETDTRKIFRRKAGASTTATQETASELTSLDSGSKGAGQYIRTTSSAFYGKILTDVQFKLHSTTAQAGAKVYARHYNSSGVLIHTYWEKLASALPSSSTWTTETTLAGDTAFANGDYFVCEYMETDGTTATGSVKTYRKHNDSGTKYDGSNSGFINTYFGSSSFLDTGARDAWFKITIKTPDSWVEKGTA